MSEPFVCCITPTHIPEYWERVKACYDSQTYQRKSWLVMDTRGMPMTVGALRNTLIRSLVPPECDFVAHFDHDDWSAPTRLAEQVAFLQATGADVVGYYDMPFYDMPRDKVLLYDSHNQHYALGTSLMYKREVWERVPFPDQTPEDTTWQNMVGPGHVASTSTLRFMREHPGVIAGVTMIQTIHPRNGAAKTGSRFQPASAELEAAVRKVLANVSPISAQLSK